MGELQPAGREDGDSERIGDEGLERMAVPLYRDGCQRTADGVEPRNIDRKVEEEQR